MNQTRRSFLYHSGLLLGSPFFPSPALSAAGEPVLPAGKTGLRILNDRPLNVEALPHILDAEVTSTEHFFIRNNGIPPQEVSADDWRLTIGGEAAEREVTVSIEDLKTRYENVSLQLTLECGGNGRAEFDPGVPGNQWTLGAVGCPLWHGVRLRDVLNDAGVKSNAVYLGYHGADRHLSGDPTKEVISRGVPIEKAMADDAIVAWGMNHGDLHPMNGAPLRLVIAGWPASCSGKWLTGLSIRDRVHDGAKMGGSSYRVPSNPVEPGEAVADADMKIIEAMPVKSLITSPATGNRARPGEPVSVRGHAWVGDDIVKEVHLSLDFGRSWLPTRLTDPVNTGAWQHFSAEVSFPSSGYYEVWARATDSRRHSQPMVLPGWNPKGYLNNACHRIAVHVA